MRATGLVVATLLLTLATANAAAQPVYKGVLWDIPAEPHLAVEDLHRMQRAGVNAVRTAVITDTLLLAMADSAGIQFFQDLPMFYLSDDVFADSLQRYLDTNLDTLVAIAANHDSADIIGLTVKSDTSVEGVCRALDTAAKRIADVSAGNITTYYVTDFVDADRCRSGPNFVILSRLASTRYFNTSPFSIPAGVTIGHRVVPGREGGWRHEASEERQARLLEWDLKRAFDNDNVRAVFVDRWSDEPVRRSHDGDALRRRYGIVGPGGIPVKGFSVMRGFYTGHQTVFAIDAGSRRAVSGIWPLILGWGLLLVLAVSYSSSPQMRQMAPRYFFSHGFFRESVAEGRDSIPVASMIMLGTIAVSAGLIGTVIVSHLSETRFAQALIFNMPLAMQDGLTLFVTQPLLLCLLIACLYALFMTMWTSLLSLWSRFGGTQLLPWQTLLLVVWPRWPIILLMLAALALGGRSPSTFEIIILCLATLTAAVHAIYRSLNDYRLTASVQMPMMILPAILNPSLVFLVAAFILVATNADTAEFLAHLLRRQ